MKKHWKRIQFAALALCLFTLAACTPKEPVTPGGPEEAARAVEAAEAGSIEDYFPFTPNTAYDYEGNGVTYKASNQVYFGYIEGGRAQRRVSTVAEASTEVLELADGKLTLIYGDPYYYFYDNILDKAPNMNVVLLAEPLKLGQTWETIATEEGPSTSEITAVGVPVSTPAGDFDALEVTTTHPNGNTELYYYAKGVGLVKSVYDSTQGQVVSELSAITEDTAVEVPLTVYVPNVTTGVTEEIETKVTLLTNGGFERQLAEKLKTRPTEEHVAPLADDMAINSITLDWDQNVARVDLSPEALEDSSVGGGVRMTQLQCLADTVGGFYGVGKVVITVDGKPYEKGEIRFAEGEYIEVTRKDKEAPEQEAPGQEAPQEAPEPAPGV